MTNEDCINKLKYLKSMMVTDGIKETFDKAIQALEQQPCEDCISRQKALDCFEQTNTRQGAKHAIETLPSVTPQRPKGKWIEEWLNSFDTSSATKCFEAVNILKQRLEGDT